jgi:DNA (cytosine-5)-methyltransferase 1
VDSIPAISLFSGTGGLDFGLSIAAPGIRWLCHVEREAYAAAILAARMEDKTLDAAPVWSDIKTFDGKPWHGKVDFITGGFPCTDLSVAGKQAGINGSASGLWWEFARIICEVQPRWVFIENVPPVLASGPARAVLGELSRLGFDAEWTTLRASEVGASHQRKRVFILAHRTSERWRERWISCKRQEELDCGAGAALANTTSQESSTLRIRNEQNQPMSGKSGCDDMENTGSTRIWHQGEPTNGKRRGTKLRQEDRKKCTVWIDSAGGEVANPSQPGRERSKQPELPGSLGLDEGRAATELRETLFPPGPGDTEAWQRILETNPEFAPALEPGVRGMADELASPLHERRHRLRATGNGVVAIQAAVAFTLLMRRIMT